MKSKRSQRPSLTEILAELVSSVPPSNEEFCPQPEVRAAQVARAAALKASAVTGSMALPPGPIGLATILPDLIAVWHIQRGLVADLAAIYGKTATLKPEAMVYCLFKHGAASLLRDLVVRSGQRYLVRRASARAMQSLLQKLGLQVTQRLIGKGLSRLAPIVGALMAAGYAYYDTTKVSSIAIDLFSRELETY
jgi:uncharacterized protein (DUF697 family)